MYTLVFILVRMFLAGFANSASANKAQLVEVIASSGVMTTGADWDS